MTPTEYNHMALFLLAAPVIGGLVPAAIPALVFLGILAAFTWCPVLVLIGIAAWFLRRPIRWFFEGLFIAEGVKFSGILRQLRPRPRVSRRGLGLPSRPRSNRYRRDGRYFPWEPGGDDWPENLGGQ
jgi:hypothetical protein